MRTSLVIPCYNESESIPQLSARLRDLMPVLSLDGQVEVIFVDDGSTDGTADAIRAHMQGIPFRIVAHDSNRGIGAALRTGCAAAYGDEIVTLDSDCTYDPAGITVLLAMLRSGYDIVTGSPYHPAGEVVNVVPWRLFLSRTLSRIYWLVLPIRLHTYTSCFRAYRRSVFETLRSSSDGFLAVTEMIVSAVFKNARITEVPERLVSRRYGVSKMKVLQVSLSHLTFIFRIILYRLTGYPLARTSEKDTTYASDTYGLKSHDRNIPGRSVDRRRWQHAATDRR